MATALEVLGRYPVPHRIAKLMTSAVSRSQSCDRCVVLAPTKECFGVKVFMLCF